MPARTADSTMVRAVRTPAVWPAERGSVLEVAQRPLPSMMMATCRCARSGCDGLRRERLPDVMKGSAVPRGANERLHVVEIAFQSATAERRQRVTGLRNTTFETLVAGDVVRLLELPRMDAEVAVRGFHEALEIIEAQRIVHGERADDAKAQTLVNQAIEGERTILGSFTPNRAKRSRSTLGVSALTAVLGYCAVLSHRASARSRARRQWGAARSRRS